MVETCAGVLRKLKAANASIKKLVGTGDLDETVVKKLSDKISEFDDLLKDAKNKLTQLSKIKF